MCFNLKNNNTSFKILRLKGSLWVVVEKTAEAVHSYYTGVELSGPAEALRQHQL